jgi:hypothetical protein
MLRSLLSTPQPLQKKNRFAEIGDNTNLAFRKKENAAQQIKLRGLRWINDEARFEHICDHN